MRHLLRLSGRSQRRRMDTVSHYRRERLRLLDGKIPLAHVTGCSRYWQKEKQSVSSVRSIQWTQLSSRSPQFSKAIHCIQCAVMAHQNKRGREYITHKSTVNESVHTICRGRQLRVSYCVETVLLYRTLPSAKVASTVARANWGFEATCCSGISGAGIGWIPSARIADTPEYVPTGSVPL